MRPAPPPARPRSLLADASLAAESPTLPDLYQVPVLGELLTDLSFARWMVEALVSLEALMSPYVFWPEVHYIAQHYGYPLYGRWAYCLGMLWLHGAVTRTIACVAMLVVNRQRQQ